jgi:hypothetical protein
MNDRLHSKLTEITEGTCEQNEYKNNPKTKLMLSSKMTKIN